jgi:adenylyl- and sulfurtransferase ThiI
MKKVIIIRYAELFLKGKNRGYFEQIFARNIERALQGIHHVLLKNTGRNTA